MEEKNTKKDDACFQCFQCWRDDAFLSRDDARLDQSVHSSPIPNQPWNPCTRIPFLSTDGTSALPGNQLSNESRKSDV